MPCMHMRVRGAGMHLHCTNNKPGNKFRNTLHKNLPLRKISAIRQMRVCTGVLFLFPSLPPSLPLLFLTHSSQDPLCPHSYQANLNLWSFYLDNHISQFPPYDTELISESDLTPLDLHYNFFEKEKSLVGQKNITFTSMVVAGMSGIGTLLLEYTGERPMEGGREGGNTEQNFKPMISSLLG